MANKKKKKAEVYWAAKDERYHFKYRDVNRKWKAKTTGETDLREALEFKKEFLEKVEAGMLPQDQINWTLKQAADRWLEVRRATVAKTTAKSERLLVKRLLEVFGNDKKIKSFSPFDLETYLLARKKNPSSQTHQPVGPRTIILELRCLRWMLDRAGRWSKAMSKALKSLNLRAPKDRIGKVLTEEQVKKFGSVRKERKLVRLFPCRGAGLRNNLPQG